MKFLLLRQLLKSRPTFARSFYQVGRRLTSTSNLVTAYREKVADGSLVYDENQFLLIRLLSRVGVVLHENELLEEEARQLLRDSAIKDETGLDKTKNVETVVSEVKNNSDLAKPSEAQTPSQQQNTDTKRFVKGLYFYGEVGTGKTLCMDLFFHDCNIKRKRRVHFHKFMLEVHLRIHRHKKEMLLKYGRDTHINLASERDAITSVANEIAEECTLLCFDEFQVTDICDAMILTKLFGIIWSKGTVLVATSNRPPDDLYKEGLNRQYFLPFVEELERRCIVKDIGSSSDYRQKSRIVAGAYYTPLSPETSEALWRKFLFEASENGKRVVTVKDVEIPVMMGRSITVTVAKGSGVKSCWATFKHLCESERGASDYHAICQHFDVVYLEGIPQLSVLQHDRARRFITLIDELYDAGINLVWTAESPPEKIFRALTPMELGEGAGVDPVEAKKAFGVDHSWKDSSSSSRVHANKAVLSKQTLLIGASMNTLTQKFSNSSGLDAAQEELEMLEGELSSIQELRFAFRRAASRLTEMAGEEYKRASQMRLPKK